jgi:uncharacterized protein
MAAKLRLVDRSPLRPAGLAMLIASLACAGLSLPVRAQEGSPPAAMTIEQRQRQIADLRAAAHQHLEDAQVWSMLIVAEVVLDRTRAQAEAGGAPVDEAAAAARSKQIARRIVEEWKQAAPESAAPYMASLQAEVPPEQRDDYVIGLLDRFPDDPKVLASSLQILARREQGQRAAELVEGALGRHPERAETWQLAVRFNQDQHNAARLHDLANAWLERQPASAEALNAWLRWGDAARDPAAAQLRVERSLSGPGIDLARVELCGQLLTDLAGAYQAAARRCLESAVERAEDPAVRERAATLGTGAGAAAGDEASLSGALAALPAKERLQAVLTAVRGLGDQACDAKLRLLRLLPWDGTDAGGSAQQSLGALVGCQEHATVRAYYLETLAKTPARDLPASIWAWFAKVNGLYHGDLSLAPAMVAVLEERLRREPDRQETWRALAEAYEIAGLDAGRAKHLEAWLAAGADLPSVEAILWLTEYQAAHPATAGQGGGGAASAGKGGGAAVATLRTAWQRNKDPRLVLALGDLLLVTGREADLPVLASELAGDSDPRIAAVAHLIRVRILLGTAGAAGAAVAAQALAEYRSYFAGRDSYLLEEPAAEYVALAANLHGPQAAVMAAQEVCARDSRRLETTAAECTAHLLEQQGHGNGAVAVLEAAAARSPGDLRLQSRAADMASAVGADDTAEEAYRRMLAIDPESAEAFRGLGRIAERRGAAAQLEALLAQAQRARGEQPVEMVVSLARVLRDQGQAQRAVDLLRTVRSRVPNAAYVDEELRLAYAALANQPGDAPPVPSSRVAAPAAAPAIVVAALPQAGAAPPPAPPRLPSPEQLRAIREADAWGAGLGGRIDQQKARDLVLAQAQLGNAYAKIRLSILQDGGTLGFPADPRQAAATAAPYLPVVRAAAEHGEPYAQYLWGTVLLLGIATPRQPGEAAVWLRRAAEQGEPWALHNLGWMSEEGQGLPKDLPAAILWYRRAAAAGNTFSMGSLARLLLEGEQAVRAPAEGTAWLAKAAERGSPPAVSWWAALLLYGGDGLTPDPVSARPWLERAAALGDPRGLYDLAAALLAGSGGSPDAARAVQLLEREAGLGKGRAMFQLTWQSALGQGMPRDPQRAAAWLERAAARGDDDIGELLGAGPQQPEAFHRFFKQGLAQLEQLAGQGDSFAGGLAARIYFSGTGVTEDDARALDLARRAARAGSTEAMRVLGQAYRRGIGVTADAAQAAAWWRRGAEGGHTFCMMWYAQMLLNGTVGETDHATGLSWLERAGEGGNAWAIHDLGRTYDEGWWGLPRDERKAAYWKRKALAFDDQEARGWLIAHGLAN